MGVNYNGKKIMTLAPGEKEAEIKKFFFWILANFWTFEFATTLATGGKKVFCSLLVLRQSKLVCLYENKFFQTSIR